MVLSQARRHALPGPDRAPMAQNNVIHSLARP